MTIKFGLMAPQGWRMDLAEIVDPIEQYEAMTRVATAADRISAFDSIWLYDHLHTWPVISRQPTFEAWTTTAALARDTKRINIGQLVTCNSYRHPALLAKMASTVDVMSHGRLYFGLGAGWYEHEYNAYGYPFMETRDRMRAFREACAIISKMWTEDEPEFKGEQYSIDKPINEPKGVRKPHPMFWIGGGGEQVTLKLVAQYGDAFNVGVAPEAMKHKLEVLRQHCENLGRDYDSITRSTNLWVLPLAPGEDGEKATQRTQKAFGMNYDELLTDGFVNRLIVDTSAAIAARMREYVALGINYFTFYIPQVAYEPERMRRIVEEVIPQVG
jgi:F420-dependent oxidoreductase-like protein